MMSRRSLARHLAVGMATLAAARSLRSARNSQPSKRMGVVVYSYHLRRQSSNASRRYPRFKDAIELMEHCHSYGAGGVQVGVNGWSDVFGRKVRDRREALGMWIEGQIKLPEDERGVVQFEAELASAKEAGASVLRVAFGGRRYEAFDSKEQWLALKSQAWKSLRLVEPIVAKHKIRLGIENHKDWRIPDMLAFMEGLSSEWVGVCIDTGNSVSLLEHPIDTVTAFAQYAVTTHIKDMNVKPYEDGFLLSEVPLGDGFVDLRRVFDICERANPNIQFCLEMITRDPLKVPCLTEKYWATFPEAKPDDLRDALAIVNENARKGELPWISGRDSDDSLRYEEANIRQCMAYAASHLGLAG